VIPRKVIMKSAAVEETAAPGAFVGEGSAISHCSIRHAAVPWLTNKDGKQEAKDDDEQRECAEHWESLPSAGESVKWVDPP
jgi:hypothetical protein